MLLDSVVRSNGGGVAYIGGACQILECEVSANEFLGISSALPSSWATFAASVQRASNGGDGNPQTGANLLALSPSLCGTALCP